MSRWVVKENAEVREEPHEQCPVVYVARAGKVVTQDTERCGADTYMPILPQGFIPVCCLQRDEESEGICAKAPAEIDTRSPHSANEMDEMSVDPARMECDVDPDVAIPSPAAQRDDVNMTSTGLIASPATGSVTMSSKGGKNRNFTKGFAKGLFVATNECSHVVYCDPKGNPKGILSEVKGKGKGAVKGKGKMGMFCESEWLFVGTLKTFDYSRDAGFVECNETRRLYQCDVYIHGSNVPVHNGMPTDKPFGFRVHVNQHGLPQVLKNSVIDIHEVFSSPRISCTFISFNSGECQATNCALQQFHTSAIGDSRDFHNIEVGSVVSLSIHWYGGWPRIARNSVMPIPIR